MSKEDLFEVNAEIQKSWRRRGAEPEVLEPSAELQGKVRETLKQALQAQLAREVETFGGLGGEKMTIHGRTGVSNIDMMTKRLERPDIK